MLGVFLLLLKANITYTICMKSIKYGIGKNLESELLNMLNTKQPILFYDTFTNTHLPIVPYYPSLYRYSAFDIYNEYTTIELKSRTNAKNTYENNFLDMHKIINNHSIFCFSYNNTHGILNDLQYIQYNKTIFDEFQIQQTKNGCDLYIIPNTTELMSPLCMNTHSNNINIHYTDEYKIQLNNIIALDKTRYISTFGFYSF
jgi:hypothetical protein